MLSRVDEAVNGAVEGAGRGPVQGTAEGKRRYDATRRRRSAAATRRRILEAARELFITDGYAATPVSAIADRAGVSPDTVYAAVGPKPAVFRELIEWALSGTEAVVPGADRDYAVRMRAEPDVVGKLAIYAEAVTAIQLRLAPLFLALRDAASTDDQLAVLWTEISQRRAANMRMLAADLATTGRIRPDLTLDEVADVIWTMNGPEFFGQLVRERGWSPDRFRDWLLDAWCRLLLSGSGQHEGAAQDAPPPES